MSFEAAKEIARAVLYEGYLLYPYRTSALKNRLRWMFGRLLPREYSEAHGETEAWSMRTECLVAGTPEAQIDVCVRFLQPTATQPDNDDSSTYQAIEREVPATVSIHQIVISPYRLPFEFQPQLAGEVTLIAMQLGHELFKLTVAIENLSSGVADRNLDRALLQSLVSTYTLLHVQNGEFLSLIDPPEWARTSASACHNMGAWPVLVGDKPGTMMLSAPIILYDYPQVAPESPGDLFDGTEIDELLSLRIQTLTDEEKWEMTAGNDQARRLLERTEALTDEQLLQLHGRFKSACSAESTFQPGDRVRLRPRQGADAMDLLLNGQTAQIVSVRRDFEDQIHLAVVLDDDPGRDFGMEGQPGHRFFFRPEEVERL
jgi:hypothetical protein